MCGPGARSCLLYQLRFQGVQQQPEGRLWHRFRAGRHPRSPRRVVRAKSRDIHVEPPEVGTAARPPTIRPQAQVNENATFGAQNLSNCKGANMNKAGFATVNPSTAEEIETFSYFTPAQTEEVIARADKSFQSFRKLSVQRRARLFTDLGNSLRKNRAQLAKVISTEMGKIFSEAEAEIEKSAHEADWYAEHGPKIMADEPAPTGPVNAYVSLGPILAIMPWNFPIWQLTRMAIPTMLAGNVVLVKHSLNTQRSSIEFERVMLEAGFPEGVFQNLILKRDDVVNVINDGRVQGASVTGSVRAGSAVASEAGKVIKKTVMELGGSDAFIVCEDADLPKAIAARISARFHNAGQVCLAAKRFILVGKIADEFERSFVEAARSLRVGDPF